MEKELKDIVIIYHGDCPDGFGGAFSAWKKYGETASYIPAKSHEKAPVDVSGKEVYLIDFSFSVDEMKRIESVSKRFVALDHHIGAKDSTESIKEHVFDNDRSGATIAWSYFHPHTSTPRLLSYVEDNDLYRFSLPHSKEIALYMGTERRDFARWNELLELFEDERFFKEMVSKGKIYLEYSDIQYDKLAATAELVEFAGYEILAVNAPRMYRSRLGHLLAEKKGPFGIVWYYFGDTWHLSLRGDGSIDLSELAKKYGGSGHHNASAIDIPYGKPLPFNKVQKEQP